MSIKFVYKILPVFIFHIKDWDGKDLSGLALGNIILISEESKTDGLGLLQHELVHVKQFYRTFGLFSLLYKFNTLKRFEYEVEAYKEQIRFRGLTEHKDLHLIERYAELLYNKYKLEKLNLTYMDILATLVN